MSVGSPENITELNPENDIDTNNKEYEIMENNMDELSSIVEGSCSNSVIQNGLLLNEAGKIIEIELEKDQDLLEKEKIIQDLMETIDSLKKNIVHIQNQYEQLDQNYQNEISYRAEVIKRTETTRGMIDSAANYSSILATSIKQLEEDKFMIAEFYNEIYQRQEQIEEKRKKIEMMVKQNDEVINTISQAALSKEKLIEEISSLNGKLLHSETALKFEMDRKLQIEEEVKKAREEINNILFDLSAEKKNRIKYETMHLKLKRKMKREREKHARKMESQSLVQKNRVKGFQMKMAELQRRADESEKTISHQLEQIKNLMNKMKNMEESSLRISESKTQKIDELEEKMKLCSIEKDTLFSQLRQLKEELNNIEMKNMKLSDCGENLKREYDQVVQKLNESEKELNRVLAENLALETTVKDLNNDVQMLNRKLTDLRDKIGSEDADELITKTRTLTEELEKHREVEKELRSKIDDLNALMSKESSDRDGKILEQRSRIERLEKEILQLKMEKQTLEEKLNAATEESIRAKEEFHLKSAKLDEEASQLEAKLRTTTRDIQDMKTHLEMEKQKNNELTEIIQNIKNDAREGEGRLRAELEVEKLRCKQLEAEVNEKIRAIEKLQTDKMNEGKLLEIEKNKLDEAERKIEHLENISQKYEESEETVASLKKSLESSKANLDACKVIIRRLENDAKKRTTSESATVMALKLEISKLKQMTQLNNNTSQCVPVRGSPVTNEDASTNSRHTDDLDKVAKTPPTSRRLLSTPVRLESSLCSPSQFKTIIPTSRKDDPYEFDSDGFGDTFDTKQTMKSSRMVSEKGRIFSKRRK